MTFCQRDLISVFLRETEIWYADTTMVGGQFSLSIGKKKIAQSVKKRTIFVQTIKNNSLSQDTPNLDQILSAFIKEHHHTDDEVRFTVEGEGIFGVNPHKDPPFEIYVESGDLLVVPANTRHWFNLTEKKSITCIRLFKENPKWEAVYEMPCRDGVTTSLQH